MAAVRGRLRYTCLIRLVQSCWHTSEGGPKSDGVRRVSVWAHSVHLQASLQSMRPARSTNSSGQTAITPHSHWLLHKLSQTITDSLALTVATHLDAVGSTECAHRKSGGSTCKCYICTQQGQRNPKAAAPAAELQYPFTLHSTALTHSAVQRWTQAQSTGPHIQIAMWMHDCAQEGSTALTWCSRQRTEGHTRRGNTLSGPEPEFSCRIA